MTIVATAICVCFILWLMVMDRELYGAPSVTLWLPTVWLWLSCSRGPAAWLSVMGVGRSGPVSVEFYLEGNPVERAVYLVLISCAALILFARGRHVVGVVQRNGIVSILFAYCAVSIMWSDFPEVAFKRWIKAVGVLLMVLIVVTERSPERAIAHLLSRMGALLIPLSVLLIVFYPAIGTTRTDGGEIMYLGAADHKNGLGILAMIVALTCAWRIVNRREETRYPCGRAMIFGQASLCCMAIGVLLVSNSKTSLACFIIGAGILIASSRSARCRRPRTIWLMVVGAVGLSVVALFLDQSGTLVGALGRTTTLTGRVGIWHLVMNIAGSSWFGTGFASFWIGDRMQEMWTGVRSGLGQTHNGYLDVYVNLGLIGVLLFGALIVQGYRSVVRVVIDDIRWGGLWLALFATALVYNLTEAAWLLLSPTWFLILLAMVYCKEKSGGAIAEAGDERVAILVRPGWQRPLSARRSGIGGRVRMENGGSTVGKAGRGKYAV